MWFQGEKLRDGLCLGFRDSKVRAGGSSLSSVLIPTCPSPISLQWPLPSVPVTHSMWGWPHWLLVIRTTITHMLRCGPTYLGIKTTPPNPIQLPNSYLKCKFDFPPYLLQILQLLSFRTKLKILKVDHVSLSLYILYLSTVLRFILLLLPTPGLCTCCFPCLYSHPSLRPQIIHHFSSPSPPSTTLQPLISVLPGEW